MQRVRVKRLNGVVVATPHGYLVGGDETVELGKVLKDLAVEGNLHLVINLGETQYLNSTALGTLLAGHANYAKRGGQIMLCCLDKRIKSIFVITRLVFVFDVYDSEEMAIASFAAGSPSTP